MPDITVQKFCRCQAPLAPVLTQALLYNWRWIHRSATFCQFLTLVEILLMLTNNEFWLWLDSNPRSLAIPSQTWEYGGCCATEWVIEHCHSCPFMDVMFFFPSMIVYIMVSNHSLDFRLLGTNHLLGILRGHNYRVCSKYFSRQNILKGGIILLWFQSTQKIGSRHDFRARQ